MSKPIITVEDLQKTFRVKLKQPGFSGGLKSLVRPKHRAVEAVHKISFTVEPGELLAFIGPNGAGKSTTIKMLTGILYPTSGNIDVLGLNPTRQRKKLAYEIGTVFGQKPQLWYHLPPADTYSLFSKIYELDETAYQERLKFLVDAFSIRDLLETPVRKLSLGQRMRCEIVATLLHRPKVVFLDEPTIGLDVIAKQKIREVIRYLNSEEGVTIFLTSHDAGDIESLSRRTIIINHGKIVFDDTTRKLKRDYIRHKVVELLIPGAADKFQFEGGDLVSRSETGVKVKIDTSKDTIDRLLSYAAENFEIEDINIYDPPMEEIISSIYQEKS